MDKSIAIGTEGSGPSRFFERTPCGRDIMRNLNSSSNGAPQARKFWRLECLETEFPKENRRFIGRIPKIFAAARLKKRPHEPFGLARRPFGPLPTNPLWNPRDHQKSSGTQGSGPPPLHPPWVSRGMSQYPFGSSTLWSVAEIEPD